MSNSQEIRTGRHCVFNMHVHLVFVAKYRRDVFTKAMLETMREVFERICLDFEAELVEFDGEHDHVHLLVNSILYSSEECKFTLQWDSCIFNDHMM